MKGKKQIRKTGGIRSIEFASQLRKNRQKALALLEKPGAVERLLASLNITGARTVKVEASRDGPAINFSIGVVPRLFGYKTTGYSNIVDMPGIGPVAVQCTFKHLGEAIARESAETTRKHEEAHIETRIIRHNLLGRLKEKDARIVGEILLSELLSKASQRNQGGIPTDTASGLVDSFVEKLKQNKIDLLRDYGISKQQLKKTTRTKIVAINDAIKNMPREKF